MSEIRIHKAKFEPGNGHMLTLPPETVRVLHVAAQRAADDMPTVWYETDVDRTPFEIEFDARHGRPIELFLVGTGMRSPSGRYSAHVHIGSAVCADGDLVWHVYGPARMRT